MAGWDKVTRGKAIVCTDCVMDGLDVEFERADDLPLLEVAEILVALVHHLAVSHLHSFRLMRTEGQGNFDKKFPLLCTWHVGVGWLVLMEVCLNGVDSTTLPY